MSTPDLNTWTIIDSRGKPLYKTKEVGLPTDPAKGSQFYFDVPSELPIENGQVVGLVMPHGAIIYVTQIINLAPNEDDESLKQVNVQIVDVKNM